MLNKIIFMMPNWFAHSELWMERMIDITEPYVAAIAIPSPKEMLWRKRLPVIDLSDEPPALWRRMAHRLDSRVRLKSRSTGAARLLQAVESKSVSTVLVHYLDFALRFERVWENTSKNLFVHCHGYDVTWDLCKYLPPDTPYFSEEYILGVRRLSKRARFIANSRTTADSLRKVGIADDRIRVKYLGVPVTQEPPIHKMTGAVNILYIGRLEDFKGPDVVIRAFEIARSRGLNASLTIAGDGELRVTCEILKRNSKFCDDIRLLGWISDREGRRLRSDADIFTAHNSKGCLSRQEEAFGVSIVEAMAAGLPVITGRSGSVGELVLNGETGILIEPGDVDAHSEAFLKLGCDSELRSKMGLAGWLRASNYFSSAKERDELLGILQME